MSRPESATGLAADAETGLPDLFRIVLHPPRLGKDLIELPLGYPQGLSMAGVDDRPAAAGALIERE